MCLGVGVRVIAVHEGDVPREGINVLQQLPEAKPPAEVEILIAHDRIAAIQGSGFRVQSSGFRVQISGFRFQGSGFRVQGSGFRVQGPGF